jgi:Cu(I)/Ag(I) efflux system membrane protein CusA/SilA
MYLEWSGEFEHQVRARKTLQIVFPAVTGIIIVLLYLTYKDWSDVGLIMLSVLGALAGGAIFQWLFEFRFSVAVWVGYIACFGMAVETASGGWFHEDRSCATEGTYRRRQAC